MFKKIFDYLGDRLVSASFCIGIAIFVWIIAWASNGYFSTKFDLNALKDFFMFVIAKYGVDSVFNSNKGETPK